VDRRVKFIQSAQKMPSFGEVQPNFFADLSLCGPQQACVRWVEAPTWKGHVAAPWVSFALAAADEEQVPLGSDHRCHRGPRRRSVLIIEHSPGATGSLTKLPFQGGEHDGSVIAPPRVRHPRPDPAAGDPMRDELLVKTEDLEEDDDRTGLQRGGDFLWDLLRTWAPAILIVLLIRSVLFEPFRIPSGSMVPTLAIGDHILVTKYSYGLRWPLTRIPINEPQVPERGDVVVFVFPGTDMDKATGKPTLGHWLDIPIPGITVDYVKRVVGLPGDKIQVRQGIVYLNDQAQPQTTDGPLEFVDDRCDAHPTIEHEENLEGREHAVLSSTVYGARMPDFGPVTVPDGHIFAMGDNRDHSSDSRVWGFVPLRNIKGRARFVWLSYDQCRPGLPLLGEIRTDRFGETIR